MATAPVDGRCCHHLHGADSRCMENASVAGSVRLNPMFQKTTWEARQCASEESGMGSCEHKAGNAVKTTKSWRNQEYGSHEKSHQE